VVIRICCLNEFTYIGILKVYRVAQKLLVTSGNLYVQSEEFFFKGGGSAELLCSDVFWSVFVLLGFLV
jgi:hypothetical protein